MKKLLSLLLVFTMMLTLVGGAAAFAADDALPEEEQLAADVADVIPDVEEAEEIAAEEPAEAADAEAAGESDELAEAPEAEEAAEEAAPETEEAPAQEAPAEEAAPALDGAANQLAAGNTYYLVSGGNYVYCEDGALKTKDAKVSGSEVGTKNPRGVIAASAGQGPNGGVTLMFTEGSYYLGVEGGAMVATSSAPQGEWILDGGKLYFDSQNGPAYVTDWSAFAVSSDASAAVAVTAYSSSGSSSSGSDATGSETTGSETTGSDTAASDSSTFEEWRGPFSGPTGEDTITVAFDISGKTIKFDHGQLSTADVVMSGDKMVIDANFVNVKAKEGGGYIFYTDAPESKLDCLYIDSDGKLANTGMEGTIPSGYWSINEGGGPSSTTFTYTDGDVVWYLMLDENGSIAATTDSSAAVRGNFYSGSAPKDMGGGGGPGGKNNVYGLMSTNPNLVKVDAPHWVNISKADRETTKDVTLTAKFPEGVKGLAMIFKWTFGDQTKEEEFPATGAENEEFTSTFTANIADLEAGVYEVQCELSYKVEKAAEDPAEDPTEDPNQGTDPAEQPSDTPAGEAGEAEDFVIDGQFIIVVVGADGKEYAISKDGAAVPYDGKASADILWTASKGGKDGVFRLTNAAGQYLTFSGSKGAGVSVTAGTTDSSWLYADGTLAYTSRGNAAEYISGVNGTTVTLGASGSAVKLYAPGAVAADGEGEEYDLVTINAPVAVNIILAKGIKENTLITFSDVHESWSDVGTAIKDTILSTGGYIPSIVLATGDFNNNRIAGFAEEKIWGCVNEVINRVALQLGQIDTVWVSGNHDNGYAAQYTNWNNEMDLGIVLSDYANEAAGISGTGIIFDTRSEGFKKNAESSKDDEGLIIIGLNYEDGDAFSSNDYGDGTEAGDSVYKHIDKALASVAADYHGELVIISSHAGLHAVGLDADSAYSASERAGGNSYSISNSAAIVNLVNSYVERYGMDVVWFFGHDHSKGEEEFAKLPGATISSTDVYGEEPVDIVLQFTYAHAGYVGSGAAGIHNNNYTYLTWDRDTITREERVADGNGTVRDFMAEGENHAAGSKSALSFTVDRDAKGAPEPGKPEPQGGDVKPGDNKDAAPKGNAKPAGKPGASGEMSPKTGDESNIELWTVVLVLCAGAAVAVLPRKKHN